MTLLTIGIPTFNRARQLEKLLARIVPACESLDIEVLVSDNCSPDDTPAVLEKFKGFKCLRYIRNTGNIGFDRNILNLIAEASGQFLWWLGDDDNLAVEQLINIKRLLSDNSDVGLFFVNYMHDLPRNKGKSSGTSLEYISLSAQQYADRHLHKATLISTNILNLAAVRSLRVNQSCIGPNWVNLHLLLLLVDWIKGENGRVVVIKNPVVIQGVEEEKTSINKWKKTFIDYFAFTISQTPLQYLALNKFKKHFYDINVRFRYLNLADIIDITDPLDFNSKIVVIFRPNIFAQLAFWLQYLISRVIRFASGGKIPQES
jgi:glycosyltransferase involved in cell wall biosynthesis